MTHVNRVHGNRLVLLNINILNFKIFMKSSCMSCFYLKKVDMLKSKFGVNYAFSYKEEHDLQL